MKLCKTCGIEKTFTSFHKRGKKYQPKCKECKKEYHKLRYREKKEHILSLNKKWREENRERKREINLSWKKRCSGKVNSHTAARRASKHNATPEWLTEEQKSEIEQTYWLARDLRSVTGEDYHVDHIVPLKGKDVCGLHVPWNLQVLPSDLNYLKGNN